MGLRRGIYNYPRRAERSLDWFIRNTIHELVPTGETSRRSAPGDGYEPLVHQLT